MPKDWSRREVMEGVAKVAVLAGLVALFVVPSDLSETTKLIVCFILLWIMVGRQLDRVGLEHLPRRRGTFSNEPSPMLPQHHKPVVDLSKIRPGGAEFFRHFSYFGVIMNSALQGSIWRVEVQAETPGEGLFLHVYRGLERVGYLQVSPRPLDYSEKIPGIVVHVRIFHARRFGLDDLQKFSGPVFRLLSNDEGQVLAAEQEMRSALIRAIWQLGPTVIQEAELDFEFLGLATRYMERAKKASVQRRAEHVPS